MSDKYATKQGDNYSSDGGSMNVAKDGGTAIQNNYYGSTVPQGASASSAPTGPIFDEIEHLLAQNKVLEAIERLRSMPEHRREAINFSHRWHDIQKREQQQILNSEDVMVELNKLATAILELREQASTSPSSPPVNTSHARKDSEQVFLCYAREDETFARRLYHDLKQAGVPAWIACEDILPGQRWKSTIKQAMKRSAFFLAILSEHSVSKTGYVQKELKEALDWLEHMPPSKVFLIPARIEDCEAEDERLQELHWVDFFPFEERYADGLSRLLRVLAPQQGEREQAWDEFEIETGRERKRPETDSDTVSSKQPPEQQPTVSLRSEPLEMSDNESKREFKLDRNQRPLDYIQNEYEERGEIVFDHATDLTWHKSGSALLFYRDVETYIQELNQQKFAGYADWRLPTIPELMSLLEPEKQSNTLYIDPIFDKEQWICWSADTLPGSSESAWLVDFNLGGVYWGLVKRESYVRCVRF